MARFLILFIALIGLNFPLSAQIDARLMQNPDVSKTQIVFAYAGDLWVVAKEGGTAHRLSSPRGAEMYPKFSPDGSVIAFSANYDGNMDVYVIPTAGGAPTRVTHHGYPDRALGWTPDGKKVLFASSMQSGRQRFNQFFTVSPAGGLPEQLPIPYGEFGMFSPDGQNFAFTTKSQALRQWKRYRGGWAADIHLFNLKSKSSELAITDIANDEFPMWTGSKIYFLSDRGPEQRNNIWVHELSTKQTRQVTRFNDLDIRFPSLGPSEIVFEAGGKLYLLGLADESVREVNVKIVTDDLTILPRTVNVSKAIQWVSPSPDGKRALFEARGEIFNVPAENGPIYNLTRSSGSAERYPAWSPDGKMAAYWSDNSGEYELVFHDLEKPSAPRTVTKYGPGFRYGIFWSPNSKQLAFIDKAMKIHLYNVEKNSTTIVDQAGYLYEGGLRSFDVSWSPDSRWIAYSRDLDNRFSAIFLYDTREGKTMQVTSGYYNDRKASFDPDGNYLYLLTGRTLNPIYSNLDNTWIYANTATIAVIPLTSDIPPPTAPKNDTAGVIKGGATEKKDEKKADKAKDETPKETVIELRGFEERLVLLPIKAGNFRGLAAVSGKLIFHRSPNTGSGDTKSPLMYYDLEKREEKTIVDDVDFFELTAKGKKILVGKSGSYSFVDVAENQKTEKKMPVAQMEMTVDSKAEWRQIFADAWRLQRDYFYDPNMHGVDWKKIRAQYEPLLKQAVTRWDVNYVIGEMIGELNASHTYRGGGDAPEAESRDVGYLGIDWEFANGAYRIARIIRGAPWDAETRSPLAESGLKVKEGDYILAVNGEPINAARSPWAAFQGLANKTIELWVSPSPDMAKGRAIIVKLMDDESRLRHLAWIEANRKRVDEASGGKIGYIYVPSTGIDGQTELVRQFMAQFRKEGLIIDERFNSGGQIPDRFIELLNRKPLAYWAVRDGKTWQWPPVAHFGHKAILVNGWSGSGGDAFPDYFRKAGLGPIIGSRTWGGLIGITGVPSLVDGGSVSVPTFRMYDPDGVWFREGHGVDPDIEVLENPGNLSRGVDDQLERAILEVMNKIKTGPYVAPVPPAYEKR